MKKPKTIVQLPSAVRTAEFAQFMLEDRFKILPSGTAESQVEHQPIYSFPHFNTSDALLYFPSAFASFMSSGDMDSLSALYQSFVHKSCLTHISNTDFVSLPSTKFLELVRLINELHPDYVMCTHATKDVGQVIQSSIYFKLTESKQLFESVSRLNRNSSNFGQFLALSRWELFKSKFGYLRNSDHELQEFHTLFESEDDIEVFGYHEFKMRYNKHSKRVMEVSFSIHLTSVHASRNLLIED
jgi:hypothetical protein